MLSLTRLQAWDYDRRAHDEFAIPTLLLMENAGRGCADVLRELNPDRNPVCVLCGPGNNGGDGFVLARHLLNAGYPVAVWAAADPERYGGDAGVMAGIARRMTPVGVVGGDLAAVRVALDAAEWVIDALYGTGLNRPVVGVMAELIAAVNGANRRVLSVDIPSGLDCDTGAVLGAAVRATVTATFVAPKRGFAAPGAAAYTGEVRVVSVGAPAELAGRVGREET